MAAKLASNFGSLEEHDEQLVRLGMLAERYCSEDPNAALLAGHGVVTATCRLIQG